MAFPYINKTQGYGILKADTVCTLKKNQTEINSRGWPTKVISKKQDEIAELIDNEPDAQYLT